MTSRPATPETGSGKSLHRQWLIVGYLSMSRPRGAAFWMGATWAARRPQQAEQLARVELRLRPDCRVELSFAMSHRLLPMLKSIRPGPSAYVFGEMGEQEPLKWLRKAGQTAGIEGHYKFHHTRDTMISWALSDPDSKLGIQDVARMVGHKSLETTRYYLQTDLEALRKKLDTLR